MNIKNKIAVLLTGICMLASCSDGLSPAFTVGEADNAIVLRAGISDGGAGVQTRAAAEYGDHAKHVGFATGTQMALRVDGTWTGHSPVDVKKKTIATLGAAADKHNPLSTYNPNIYWDDYGTADPDNKETGRATGLTIYGAAVDGKSTLPTTLSSLDDTQGTWTSLSWNVGAPENEEIDQSSGFADYDLVTSNNVSTANSNAYKFINKADGKLLEFTHAMTKVTVNLTAGDGFPGYDTAPENAKFEKNPSVTLLGFNYTGTVNVEAKTSTPTPDTKTNFITKLAAGGKDNHTARFETLVFPGNTITDNATDYILELDADGNVLQVSGKKLHDKMTELSHGNVLKQGVNYVINITINKTDIKVEATIKDWENVEAANEEPVINIADAYGHTGDGFNRNFDFYRSTAVDGSYLTGIDGGNRTVANYVPEAGSDPVVPAHYDLATQMYWPNHTTHYFFRGVWPTEGVNIADIDGKTRIAVENVAYQAGTFPSDLMIGAPRKDGGYDETCKVAGHDKSSGANGICATEGRIRMNFQYAMSQVIVNLTTSGGGDQVVFDEYTKVEIIGGYDTGAIKLSDESSVFSGDPVDYVMHRADAGVHTGFHDAIIPQTLQDGSGNATLKFRITVKSGDTFDKYETVLGIKDIEVTEGGEKKHITSWAPGKRYTYTLHITKSGIKVEATIKDWIDVTAGTDVWF